MGKNTERTVMQGISPVAYSPDNSRIKGLFIVFLVMAATSMYSCKSNNNSATAQYKAPQVDTNAVARDSIQSQYNAARVQIDDLNSKSAVLDSQIRLKDLQIATLQKEKGRLGKKNRLLAGKLKKDNKMIASLNGRLSDKDKEYAEKLGILQSDRDNLSNQLSDLTKKYGNLKALGSVLHASAISIEPLHLKKHGRKEKITKRAKKLNILRIHFDIDENRIAEDGTKQLYLVIDGPDGKVLSGNDNKSGELTTYKGSKINYSVLKEIYLKQNEPVKDVTVDWKEDGEHEKGDYNIAIYNGGYKIGAGSVALR